MAARILVIDDNESNLKLASDILESAGYDVRRALHAREALQIVAKESVDLILMDILLPDMDGLHLTSLLKKHENTKNIPIVALTALAMTGDREKAMLAGCDGYMTKPIISREFLSYLKGFLEKQS
ncbi:MAG: response regulator [Acidobacteriota bacterium]